MGLGYFGKFGQVSVTWAAAAVAGVFFFNTSALAQDVRAEDRGKTHLNFASYNRPSNLHPWYSSNAWTSNLAVNLFEGLTMDGPQGRAIGALAQSWAFSEDQSKITFKIRPGVQWSDGTPITAKVFYDNYIALLQEPSLKLGVLHDLVRGGADFRQGKIGKDQLGLSYDQDSLTFHINSHAAFFPEILAHNTFALVPFHALESNTQSIDVLDLPNLPTTGAYMVTQANESDLKLVANPAYYDYGQAALEVIQYSWTEQPDQTLYHQILNGDIDFAFVRPTFQTKFLKENFAEFLFPTQGHSMDYYLFNTTIEPFNKVDVRRALSMAIDRDRLDNSFGSDELSGSSVMVPKVFRQGMHVEEPDWMGLPYPRKVEKARELLGAHGFTAENPLKVTISFNQSELHQRISVAIASMWAGLGVVKVDFQSQPIKAHYAAVRPETAPNPTFDVARAGWTADFPDATDFLSLLRGGSRFNYSRWSNEAYDKIMQEIFTTQSEARRAELSSTAMRILIDEAPVIPLFSRADIILKNPELIVPSVEGDRAYEFRWFSYK